MFGPFAICIKDDINSSTPLHHIRYSGARIHLQTSFQFTRELYMRIALLSKGQLPTSSCEVVVKLVKDCKWEPHSVLFPQETQFTRRQLCTTTSLVAILTFQQATILEPVNAVDKADIKEDDEGVFGTINSLFDPNEKTKSGKVLPKAYLKSAREVLKTLRESLKENPKDMAKFRRTADAAKESIRDYLSNWRGQQAVAKEESYVELEKVFRTLASFYAKAGPSASLSDEVKSKILHDLDTVEEFL